jgi:hypothetical protein
MMGKNRLDMKWKRTNPLTRRNLITAIILLLGLGSAILIYLTADNAAESGLVNDFENSKKYMHDLELYGGKANVLANELSNWFAGLWRGKSLAFTVGFITIVIALGFFFFSSEFKNDEQGGNKRGGSAS